MDRTDRRDLSRESSSPARTSPPLAVLVAVAAPPLLFAATYRASRRCRDFELAIDLRLLTAIQSWRVLGGMFLVLYAFDLLPGAFAWPAGAGDMAVGLAAPFVLLPILRCGPFSMSSRSYSSVGSPRPFGGGRAGGEPVGLTTRSAPDAARHQHR
jgi:hypothetical protein